VVTDQDLTQLLKRSFDELTTDVVAAPNIGTEVRRRHRIARRRVRAAQVALPAAAAASVGWVVVSGTHDAPVAPSAHGTGVPAAHASGRAPIRTVSYRLALPRTSTSFPCLTAGTVQATHESTTWLVGGGTDCTMIVVQSVAALPVGAAPIELAGVPGLYGSSDADSRTVYSRDANGATWSAVTVAASVSDATLARFYVPAG
jgi:hypothetical protein